jgi:hypothetical protein
MPLLLWQGWAWLSWLGGGFVLPLLKKVPWQVWAGIACIIAVLYYGHVREKRGYDRCQAEVKVATDTEVNRQNDVANDVINASRQREAEASAEAQQASGERDALLEEVKKLKTAKTVCVPKSITDRYQHPRSVQPLRAK